MQQRNETTIHIRQRYMFKSDVFTCTVNTIGAKPIVFFWFLLLIRLSIYLLKDPHLYVLIKIILIEFMSKQL